MHPFWTQPNAQHVWRDVIRTHWSAEERGFNADAVLGRVSAALYFPPAGAAANGEVEVEVNDILPASDSVCALLNNAIAQHAARSTCSEPAAEHRVGETEVKQSGVAAWLRVRRSTVLRYTLISILLFFFAIFFRRALTSVVEATPEQIEYTKHVRSVRKSRRLAPRTEGDEICSDKCD